jgi:2-methylcitrate dehydratase PrpD
MADLMSELVCFVVNTEYEDLSPAVVEYGKKHILDTLGVTIAGTSAEGVRPVVDLAVRWGGTPESTIPVFGAKVPAPAAALAMGPMARALDFGGIHPEAIEHNTEYVLPAALPVAELQKCSGRELIVSVVLGNEVIARTGAAVSTVTPSALAKTHGIFRIWGPVAAVGRLLRLDEELMLNAMGLAYTQGGGDMQMYADSVLKIRVQHGLVADVAIKCALLAEAGITGTRNILEGEKGLFSAFFPGQNDPSWITAGLPSREFKTMTTRIKMYPSCTYTHSAIEAALHCVRENDIPSSHIAAVTVGVNTPTHRIVCEPSALRHNPTSIASAQFSIPYTVATALVTGNVSIQDFTQDALLRSEVRQMMQRVVTYIDQELDSSNPLGFAGARVRISTKDGSEFEAFVEEVKGSLHNPVTFDELVDKFTDCISYSAKPISNERAAEMVEMVRNLEDLKDVSQLVSLLAIS